MPSEHTQITTASSYNTKNMIFSEPVETKTPTFSFRRIMIQTKNTDKTTGDLVIATPKLFSFGVQENKSTDPTKPPNGYSMALSLWNRDGCTDEEKKFTDTYLDIINACREHVLNNKDSIQKYDLEKSDLKKLDSLWWKRDKGQIVEGTGPTLYAKLISSKKDNKILTLFYNEKGDPVDPLSLFGKYCNVYGAIQIQSIFIGLKISVQVKLYECEVKLIDTGMRRLLRPESQPTVSAASSSSLPLYSEQDDNEIKDDDDIPVEEPVKPKTTVVRKVKKIIRKSEMDD